MTHNINDKTKFPRKHVYACMDGVNLFARFVVGTGDVLIINGEKYALGKGKGMPVKAKKRKKDGLYYHEFTITKIDAVNNPNLLY